ncbi:hypothetical protein OHJ21_07775 [Virgibacillus sp. LDC1]|nr:hypothetical protein [Virgibacillus sp. LDC1]
MAVHINSVELSNGETLSYRDLRGYGESSYRNLIHGMRDFSKDWI